MMNGGREMTALRRSGAFPLIAALLLVALCRAQTEEVLKLAGSNDTLTPTYTGSFKEITWYLNRNKMVELELDENLKPTWYKPFSLLKAGASLNNLTGALTIPHLTTRDSGEYRAEVKLNNQTLLYTDITLTVRDHVIKPTITIQSRGKEIELRCESASADVRYTWQDDTGSNVSYKQTYDVSTLKKPTTFTCIVNNTVSEDKTSETYPPPSEGGSVAGIVIGILVPFLIIIIIIFEVIRCKRPNAPCLKYITNYIPPLPYDCKKGNADERKDGEAGQKMLNPAMKAEGNDANPHNEGNGTQEKQQSLPGAEEKGNAVTEKEEFVASIDFTMDYEKEGNDAKPHNEENGAQQQSSPGKKKKGNSVTEKEEVIHFTMD